MIVFASFNGGPSDLAVNLALVASTLTGVIVGGIVRRPGIGFLIGLLSGVLSCGVILLGGNQGGDAAGLFLVGALIIFCPLCGLLSGAGAAMSGWIAGKLLNPDHKPTQEGAISTTDMDSVSTEAEQRSVADRPREERFFER
jgi:hypothetical protein